MDGYEKKSIIGRGAYGTVFLWKVVDFCSFDHETFTDYYEVPRNTPRKIIF